MGTNLLGCTRLCDVGSPQDLFRRHQENVLSFLNVKPFSVISLPSPGCLGLLLLVGTSRSGQMAFGSVFLGTSGALSVTLKVIGA